MRPPMPSMNLSRRSKIILGVVAAMILLFILAGSLVGVYVNWLWFGEVGFRSVYRTILFTRIALFFIFGLLMAAIIGVNIWIAYRIRPPFRPMSAEQQNLERYRLAIEPRKWLIFGGIVGIAFLSAGSSAQNNWRQWLLFFNAGSFGVKDQQFHRDVSFFAWDYPVYRIVLGFGFAAIIFSILLSAAVHYLYGALRLQTVGPKITIAARRHLTVLVFFFIVLKAFAYWLDRYGLVFSNRGKVTGASYTDVNASLYAKTILFWIAVIIAVGVLATMWLPSTQTASQLPAIGFVVLIVISIVIGGIYPALVQQITVKPNASVKEAKYILRNIIATRQAYDIVSAQNGGTVTYTDYGDKTAQPAADLSNTANAANAATVSNIRLLDPNIVSPTFTQLQQLRNYYGFATKLDIDRYTIDGKTKDYIVGVRELQAANLQGTQTNWISEHTAYTHGFGFVAAAADAPVSVNSDFVEGSIPPQGPLKIKEPRVYFGEDGVDYSIVGAKGGAPREFDGSGANDSKITYRGTGGVPLGNLANRLAFAVKYGQVNFLLNGAASSPGARVIFNRDPRDRVLKVAPFLKVDSDPYPSVINGRIVWILDGYTTMANYPYSEREQLANLTESSLTTSGRTAKQQASTFNYIRNSVKATVDAFDGTVRLYQWNEKDPVLKAWMKIFPGRIQPKSAIPQGVLDHIRYPQDLFEVQRSLLERYHVNDPVQFYTSSDQWTIPQDPYPQGVAAGADQPPYYLLAAPPTGGETAEYQLTTTMRVNQRANLAAYISVNAQNGPDYGKMTVLRVPSGVQTFGPAQVANQFKSQTKISQEVTLFDQGGSKVLYGNLLSLPIGNSFLYVEPMYVQGSGATTQPLLRRVIVYYAGAVGYDETLSGALKNLTEPVVGQGINESTTSPTTPTTPSTPSTPSSSGSSSSSGGGGGAQTLDQILKQIDNAAQQLQKAYSTGDLEAVGKWTAELKRLTDLYLKKRGLPTNVVAPR
jgi:uncharacterized membrane protein (UPF0182 family)